LLYEILIADVLLCSLLTTLLPLAALFAQHGTQLDVTIYAMLLPEANFCNRLQEAGRALLQ
jgi:hypothetical protein